MKTATNTRLLLLLSATSACLLTLVLAGPSGSRSDSYKLRLVSTNANSKEGRLEIFHKNKWGTVCKDGWTDVHASVACRSMGLGNIGKTIGTTPGTGQIWLDGVQCKIHHGSLSECCHNEFGVHDCTHNDDVAIMCHENVGNTGYGGAPHLPQPYVPHVNKDKTLPNIEPNGPPQGGIVPTRMPQGVPRKNPDTVYPSDFNVNNVKKPDNQVWPGRSDPRIPPPEPPHPDPVPGKPGRPIPRLPGGAVVIGGPSHNRASQGSPRFFNREAQRSPTTTTTVRPSFLRSEAVWFCNFDDGTECNVYVQDDRHRWNSTNSRSSSIKDHTAGGNDPHKVAHTESQRSVEAIINTPTHDKSYPMCLTVRYYIISARSEDAEFSITRYPVSRTPDFKRAAKRTSWTWATVDMPNIGRHYHAVIKAKVKNGATVGIDDLAVRKGECRNL